MPPAGEDVGWGVILIEGNCRREPGFAARALGGSFHYPARRSEARTKMAPATEPPSRPGWRCGRPGSGSEVTPASKMAAPGLLRAGWNRLLSGFLWGGAARLPARGLRQGES